MHLVRKVNDTIKIVLPSYNQRVSGQIPMNPVTMFEKLEPRQKQIANRILCNGALQCWERFCLENPVASGEDPETGEPFLLEVTLLQQALADGETGADRHGIAERLQGLIDALETEQMILPQPVTFACYAIYNYFRKYGAGEVVDDWLIANQAISSETDETAWVPLLLNAIWDASVR